MAISVVAVGTTQQAVNTGTASISVTPTLPAGTASGDRVFIAVANSPATTTPTTPSGWTLVATASLGTGTLGATAGPRRMSVYYRDYDGVWTMPSVVLPSVAAPAMLAQSISVTKSSTEAWDTPVATQGSDTTVTATAFSATGAANLSIRGGAWVMAAMVGPGLATKSAGALTATGATFGTVTERADWASSGATNGVHAAIHETLASGGGSTAAPVHTATVSTSGQSSGGAVFVKQDLVPASPPGGVTGVQYWWRADTIAQANGSAVSSWAPMFGPLTFTQATGTAQPSYQTAAFNGQPAVRFDGTSDVMNTTLGQTINQPYSVVVAVDVTATNRTQSVLLTAGGSSGGIELVTPNWTGWGGSANLSGGAASTDPSLVAFAANGASSVVYINGVAGTAGNSGTSPFQTGNLLLGNHPSVAGRFLGGDVAEVIIYNRALTQTDVDNLKTYFDTRYSAGPTAATAAGAITLGGTITGAAPALATGGSITLGGSVTGRGAASTTGTITLGGTVTGRGAASTTGTITLGGTSAVSARPTATGAITLGGAVTAPSIAAAVTGTITLGGSATPPPVPATASGAITLSGSIAAQAPIAVTGQITLGGTVTGRGAATTTGVITLGGTAAAPTVATAANGTITLDGSIAPQAPAAVTGVITLGGSVTARGAAAVTGQIVLGGSVTGRAAATATGVITLGGTATGTIPGVNTAAGTITLGGTIAGGVRAVVTGTVTLGGSVTGQGPAVAGGTIELSGSVIGRAAPTTGGVIDLGGVPAARGDAAAIGTITLSGSAGVQPATPAAATGTIILSGSTGPVAVATGGGVIVLGGVATVALPAGAQGLITLSGIAYAQGIAAITSPDRIFTVPRNDRVFTVLASSRSAVTGAGQQRHVVPHDDRTYRVPEYHWALALI